MTENSFQVFINSVHNKIIYVIVLVPYHQVLHQTTPHKYSTHSYLLLNNCRFDIFHTAHLQFWLEIPFRLTFLNVLHIHQYLRMVFYISMDVSLHASKFFFIKYTMSQKHWNFYSTHRWERSHGFLSRHHFRNTIFVLWYLYPPGFVKCASDPVWSESIAVKLIDAAFVQATKLVSSQSSASLSLYIERKEKNVAWHQEKNI